MWGHSGQVTVWVAREGPGREAAPSDFAPRKKTPTLEFDPSPCPGCPHPTKIVSCLGCPDMSPTRRKRPRVSVTSWGRTMRG